MNKIVNPFRYLPIRQATCWGLVVLILTSIFCWQVGLRMTSLTQVNFAGDELCVAFARQLILLIILSLGL